MTEGFTEGLTDRTLPMLDEILSKIGHKEEDSDG